MDDFDKRFSAAKSARMGTVEDEAREVYKFAFNGRESEWDMGGRKLSGDPEADEIFTDIVATVAEDFGGELFSTMMPENAPWVEYEAGNAIGEDDEKPAKEELKAFEEAIDAAIAASNFYDEAPSAFNDAAVGNIALWVERPDLVSPILCEAVPISEIYVRLGPRGLEDRFRCRSYYYHDLNGLFPEATFSAKIKRKIKNAKNAKAKVIWGFWRDYTDPMAPEWRQAIRVDGEPIGLDVSLGSKRGACPLIVGRYNPVPGSAWGRGPGRRVLPTLRSLDEITRMNLEGMDRQLDPAVVYPHDGMLDLSDGIETGLAYPAMPGSAENIKELGIGGNLDYGFFTEERMTEIVRNAFFREVTQRGKTPPSASQYMGEEQKELRRLARPAAKTWREFGVGFLERVEFLEREPGGGLVDADMPMIEDGKIVARPISPLERAQAREDVLMAQSIMGMAQEGLGPDQAGLLIDGPDTFRNIKDHLKDKLVTFRSEEQIVQLAQAMMQPQQGATDEQPG